jgi:hypothetical protein
MKRLLLVCVLAAACLGLLAAPAFAQSPLQDGVYVFIYDGSWFEWADGAPTGTEGVAGTALPADEPVWLLTVWAAYGRGHIQSIGNVLVESLSIDGQPVVSGKAASKALWSVPYPSEQLNDVTEPFNPRMRIGGWVAFWLFPVTLEGDRTYTVTGAETAPHPFTDLGFPAEKGHGPSFYPVEGIPAGPFGPWQLVLP